MSIIKHTMSPSVKRRSVWFHSEKQMKWRKRLHRRLLINQAAGAFHSSVNPQTCCWEAAFYAWATTKDLNNRDKIIQKCPDFWYNVGNGLKSKRIWGKLIFFTSLIGSWILVFCFPLSWSSAAVAVFTSSSKYPLVENLFKNWVTVARHAVWGADGLNVRVIPSSWSLRRGRQMRPGGSCHGSWCLQITSFALTVGSSRRGSTKDRMIWRCLEEGLVNVLLADSEICYDLNHFLNLIWLEFPPLNFTALIHRPASVSAGL